MYLARVTKYMHALNNREQCLPPVQMQPQNRIGIALLDPWLTSVGTFSRLFLASSSNSIYKFNVSQFEFVFG